MEKYLQATAAAVPEGWEVNFFEGHKNRVVVDKSFEVDTSVIGNYMPDEDYSYSVRITFIWESQWSDFRKELVKDINQFLDQRRNSIPSETDEGGGLMMTKGAAWRRQQKEADIMREWRTEPATDIAGHSVLVGENLTNRVRTTTNYLLNEAEATAEMQGVIEKVLAHWKTMAEAKD